MKLSQRRPRLPQSAALFPRQLELLRLCERRYRPPVFEAEGSAERRRERRISEAILWVWLWHAVAPAAGVWR